ncbi:MAG: hypothetical protein A2252_01230 [Elusimicrobia bacterium RIFOXYA2_FULL_39_19]|nr:MAG: hypothetical protein A2252_01230 [Elusimicrobia bacterium RIFOXYA2_FULL_39_19]
MKYCHKCLTPQEESGQPGFKTNCEKCSSDLHVCLNCRFYDTHQPYQCAEHIQEPVADKARFNFCEQFMFADKPLPDKKENPVPKAKQQWEKIFKQK